MITKASTRNSLPHKLGLSRINDFDRSLRLVLDLIFENVNKYLAVYFDLRDIKIEYILKPITFHYPKKAKLSWYLETDLRLNVYKNGAELGQFYKDYLNEARLSSVAICLYLASLKLFPDKVEYKLIYLDDIFIGLDTSNRIPIINILSDEFKDYQIIISTYDKNFYDVCKHKLGNDKILNLWKAIEIYVGESVSTGTPFDIPIILSNSDDLAKARYYLYNNQNPDYPASANYFRKYLENQLKKTFPSQIFRNNDLEEIESYKLSKIFKLCLMFLENLNFHNRELKELQSYLFILLHPLSHYNSSTNTYKRDLKQIDKCIITLFEKRSTLSFLENLKFFIFKKEIIRLEFFINKYTSQFYEFIIEDSLFYDTYLKKFSKTKMTCVRYYGTKNNKVIPVKNLNIGTSKIRYDSISDAISGIEIIILKEHRFYKIDKDLLKSVKLFDGQNWVRFCKD